MGSRAWIAVASLAIVLFAGPASLADAATYKIHWYLGHKNLDYFEQAAADFKKEVETRSHGDISVEIITAANDEGQGAEIASKVESGQAEMGHSFADVMGRVDPRLYAFEAPYLMRDYRHMESVIEGPVGSGLLDGLRAHNMVGLSFTYSGGASAVASVDREIRRPEDLRGLKVGVYGDAVNAAWLRSLGATPVPIRHDLASITRLSREGSLDAVVITWRNFEQNGLDNDFQYVNMQGSTYLVSMTYINEKFFESLPKKYRALITEASLEAGRVERARTIDLNERAKREMMAKGVRPIYLTEDGQREFAQALRPAYEGSIDGLIGKDLIERIRKTPDAPSMPWSLASR